MLKKIFTLILVMNFFSDTALAIQNSREYEDCMRRESSDAGTAQCYENEVKYFREMTDENIKYLKKWFKFTALTNNQAYNLDNQYQAFNDFLEDYCKYYVKAKQGKGYSDRYLLSDCQIGYVQMYAGYLNGVIVKGANDCGE